MPKHTTRCDVSQLSTSKWPGQVEGSSSAQSRAKVQRGLRRGFETTPSPIANRLRHARNFMVYISEGKEKKKKISRPGRNLHIDLVHRKISCRSPRFGRLTQSPRESLLSLPSFSFLFFFFESLVLRFKFPDPHHVALAMKGSNRL